MLSELPSDDFEQFAFREVDSQERAAKMYKFFESLPPGRERARELLDWPEERTTAGEAASRATTLPASRKE
jgi:hypothetical protein